VGKPESASPQAAMMQMISGKWLSRCVSLAAELAIADHLRNGPDDAVSLAAKTGTDADALYRILRLLAASGIFAESPNRRFENNALSDLLRSDAPGSLRDFARWVGTEFHWRMVAGLDYSVATGQPALSKENPGKDAFAVLAEDRKAQQIFNDAMSALSAADGAAIVQTYEFSRFRAVIDVGGGHGTLAMMIAEVAPEVKLRVLDQPHVIDGTRNRLAQKGLANKIEAIAGNFFDRIPGPADLCVLKHIIHDWDDENSRRILKNCRDALADDGRILVCETLISDGPESIPAKVFDIEMLLGPGGRERSEQEFAALFASTGMKLNRVIETSTPLRLLEVVVA
jgi:SAM-dependent methyltransferase